MRFQNPIILTFSLCTLLMIAGCGKSKSGDAKPANPEGEHAGEHHGPHKGMLFDVGPDHKVLGEAVITTEPRKLELYLLDHNDTKKAIISTSKTITITSINNWAGGIDTYQDIYNEVRTNPHTLAENVEPRRWWKG